MHYSTNPPPTHVMTLSVQITLLQEIYKVINLRTQSLIIERYLKHNIIWEAIKAARSNLTSLPLS